MDEVSQLPYLYLTTIGWKSGRPHKIEIWFAALNGRYYMIAERGEASHWVQNLRRQPTVTFRVGEQSFNGTARIIEAAQEPELHREVSQLFEAKYDWSDGLIVELTADES